jgi:hypothetical protein
LKNAKVGWTQPNTLFFGSCFYNGESPWGARNTFEIAKGWLDSNHHHLVVFGLMLLQWRKSPWVGGTLPQNVRLDSITASSLAPYLNIVSPLVFFSLLVFAVYGIYKLKFGHLNETIRIIAYHS